MGLGGGGQKVDKEVKLLAVSVGAETHVVNSLDGGQNAQTFLAKAQGAEEGRARAVDVAVVVTGVVDLVGVFGVPRKAFVGQIGSGSPSTHVVGEVEHGIKALLEFGNKAGADRGIDLFFRKDRQDLVKAPFPVEAAYDALPFAKVKTLTPQDALDGEAMAQVGDDADAIHRIVQSQAPLLIRAENQARAKLLIEISDGYVPAIPLEPCIAVTDTFAAESGREAEHDVLVVLVPHARAEVAIRIREERKALAK